MFTCNFAKVVQIGIGQLCRGFLLEVSYQQITLAIKDKPAAHQQTENNTGLILSPGFPHQVQYTFFDDSGARLSYKTGLPRKLEKQNPWTCISTQTIVSIR